MIDIIWIIGVLIVVEGAVFVVKPGILKWALHFIADQAGPALPAVLQIAVGMIFLVTALKYATRPAIIITFGILLCASGLAMLFMGLQRVKPALDWLAARGNIGLRAIAVIEIILGAIIIYAS